MLLHFILCILTFPSTMALGTVQGSNSSAMNNIAKPGCQTHCGNITVPYPFGIGKDNGCSLNSSFDLNCDTSFNPPKLYLPSMNSSSSFKIYNISDSELRVFTSVGFKCYDQDGTKGTSEYNSDTGLRAFTFSGKNKFTVIGCDDIAVINDHRGGRYASGCYGLCTNLFNASDGECSGNGCCQTSITRGLQQFFFEFHSLLFHKNVTAINNCGYAFLGEENTFRFGGASDLSNSSDLIQRVESSVLVVIDWVIGYDRNSSQATECKENSECHDADGGGYHCRCNKGYEGNPYLDQGCQDINECENREDYPCYGVCVNTRGSYDCMCDGGLNGNATIPNGCNSAEYSKLTGIKFTFLGVVLGTVILVLSIGVYKLIQKRKDKRRKEKFFKRNGGLLLQQQTSNGEHASVTTRMFSATELEKATDQYNKNRILGRGGQGTVYKGMLADGKIVAIKKSLLVDETQIESFINEVFLLSQISHRNVVKLLGCCLETEVPILVYEFVSNGDLCQFIHNANYEFPTFWSIRLQIATEVAGALAYMHSATSIPIYHRDIKSSNILLDEKFRAKLSDFGISKSVLGDKTHLSTLVKGTFGYLDPEYFQSNRFTEKSDVYSFGIVLVELLTGKKPIYSIGSGESRGLATLILSSDEGLLLENIDNRVLDGPNEHLVAVAKLAKRCLKLNGKLRPTMKEVATELEGIRSSH